LTPRIRPAVFLMPEYALFKPLCRLPEQSLQRQNRGYITECYGKKEVIMADEQELQERIEELERKVQKLKHEIKSSEKQNASYKTNLRQLSKTSEVFAKENERQKSYMRLLLESCPSIIFLLDDKLNYIFGTNNCTEIFSIVNHRILEDNNFRDIVSLYLSPDIGQLIIKESLEIISETKFEGRFNFTLYDNYYTGSATRYTSDSQFMPNGVLITIKNITEIQTTLKLADNLNESKIRFLVNTVNALESPLQSLEFSFENIRNLLPEGKSPGAVFENSAVSLQCIAEIVEEMKNFMYVESGKPETVPQTINLAEELKRIGEEFSNSAKKQYLNCKIEISPNLPAVISIDAVKMERILLCIMKNALQYTKTGYVLFRVMIENDNLYFEIKDTGVGIKTENIPKIFTPFEQFETASGEEQQGIGLGLPIAERLVKALDGYITVESTYGEGSNFCVILPFKKTENGGEYGVGI
jgi:signal transduction histidine kinase